MPELKSPFHPFIFLSLLISFLALVTFGLAETNLRFEEEPEIWSFLSITTIGAAQFLKAHPTYDGRGVVIIICDTGVDMGVPGLLKTTTGETKVIDAQDFSGQGDVELDVGELKTEEGENFILHPDGLKLVNYDKLPLQPMDGEYLIGYLDEKRFQNSTVKDINNNGKQDDRFGVLVFRVHQDGETYDVAYVDTDADGHIDDEKPLRDYKIHLDAFQMRGHDVQKAGNPLTFALNIKEDDMMVSFHFDDSGHGTHVAGIAAGYQIHGQEGLNGIAPGAKVISLKIGNNTYAGGCTVSGSMKKALRYGVNYARQHKVPVVFNMSYGIGSELEGRSEIEELIDDILIENPDIAICLSNGNSGPGISSTGNPAGSSRAFSTGALLPRTTAQDCYGAQLSSDKIFVFSARGGEVPKPDALAPGVAISTVPRFATGDRMRGTSMASPQMAGATALLMSAAIQQQPPIPYNNILLKRALKYSATPLPDYTFLDQGNGVVNVPKAFEILCQYAQRDEAHKLLDYEITTLSPVYPDGKGSTAYWRSAGYFPTKIEQQTFQVQAIFPDSLTPERRAEFYRAFELRSTHPWLKASQKSTYIRGEKATTIDVSYDPVQIQQPGLYVGKIVAYRKDAGGTKFIPANIEFELLNTVIIPYTFHVDNNYQQEFRKQNLEPGDIKRYFFLVPPEASTAQIQVEPSAHHWCLVQTYLYDPAGHRYAILDEADSKTKTIAQRTISREALKPGIWELVTYAPFTNKEPSYYDLAIGFTGFKTKPSILETFEYELGEKPNGTFEVTNLFREPFFGSASGTISGYRKITRKKLKSGTDTYRYTFDTTEEMEKVVFNLEIPPEFFNLFTD
ncbi:MAG: S8 family serine peptidase, partial [candidate division KSB1 bacterium]|nr:S8 family serine peptidase [candidate division KSB1 bacterium]